MTDLWELPQTQKDIINIVKKEDLKLAYLCEILFKLDVIKQDLNTIPKYKRL